MTIINDDSRIINKLETSLTDNARVVIYDCHMFIVQATGFKLITLFSSSQTTRQNKQDHVYQPSLIFESQAGAQLCGAHGLTQQIFYQNGKVLLRTNALAYLDTSSLTKQI